MKQDLPASQLAEFSMVDDSQRARSDRSLGAILLRAGKLELEQVEQVAAHQRETGGRFGDAAVSLRLITQDDVLWALSQQFDYPYALDGLRHVHDELVVVSDPFSAQAEAIRELRSQLLLGLWGPNQRRCALAVVSPNKGDGKTFFAANMAAALSQLGRRTLLVDADMRTPRLHRVFGISNASGLTNLLSRRGDTRALQIRNLPSLFVMPVGTVPPNPVELAHSPVFGQLINKFLGAFDYVVVDTPAAAHGVDFKVIASHCGAALAIAREGDTPMHAMSSMVTGLAQTTPRFAGVVMNRQAGR